MNKNRTSAPIQNTWQPPRSTGNLKGLREPISWNENRNFKILSLAGGGIRGIFQAEVLSQLEKQYLNGEPIGKYFDLITGTSTGGIIAIALGKGLSAQEISEFYRRRGREIFPPVCTIWRKCRKIIKMFRNKYDPDVLKKCLDVLLGNSLVGDSKTMLCIPASEGEHSDVVVYKTDHHPDYKMDWKKPMVEVAMATSAAPVYFRIQHDRGYKLMDGGLWANDPILIGAIEALTSFSVPRSQIKILSITNSTGNHPVLKKQAKGGGFLAFHTILDTMLAFQSEGAKGQASLLLGADSVLTIKPSGVKQPPIALDDWKRSVQKLPPAAISAINICGQEIRERFLSEEASPYIKHHARQDGCYT